MRKKKHPHPFLYPNANNEFPNGNAPELGNGGLLPSHLYGTQSSIGIKTKGSRASRMSSNHGNTPVPISKYGYPSQYFKSPQFGFGGTFGSILKTASPFLSAIPGAGIPLAIGAGVAGSALQSTDKDYNPSGQFNFGDAIQSGASAFYPSFMKGTQVRNGGMYAQGGYAGAEVEKQESAITPDGQAVQYNGPSHEQGGINTVLPEGSMIFSDSLKPPGMKETYADLNKPYISSISRSNKLLEKTGGQDKKYSLNTKKMTEQKSQTLFQNQEELKQQKYFKSLGRLNKKYGQGGTIKKPLLPGYKYGQGGTEQGPIDPNKSTAYNWGSMQNDFSGYVPNMMGEMLHPQDYYMDDYRNQGSSNPQGNSNGSTNSTNPYSSQLPSYLNSPYNSNFTGPIPGNDWTGQGNPSGISNTTSGNKFNWGNLGKEIGADSPILYDLAMGIIPSKKTDINKFNTTGRAKWKNLTDQETLRQNNTNYRTGLYNMKNSGGYRLSGQTGLNNSRNQADDASIERINNINSQGDFQAQGINLGIEGQNNQMRYRVDQDNLAGQAKQREYLGKGLKGVSSRIQGRENDNMGMDWIAGMVDNPQFNNMLLKYGYKRQLK